MQLRTYSVADEISYHRVTACFGILLDRMTDVTDPVARNRLGDALKKSFSGRIHECLCLFGHITAGKRPGIVAVISFQTGANINADDIAVLKDLRFAGYAVNDYMINRNARTGRKTAVTEEGGGSPLLLDILTDQRVEFIGGNTRLEGRFSVLPLIKPQAP